MWKLIKEYWNISIGIFSTGAIIFGSFAGDSKGIVLSISISVFASWLLFFLADFLPSQLRNQKAFTFVQPKLKAIYDSINKIDDVLCFYVNISVEQDIEKKAESIKHIISIDTINVHEEVFYNPANPQRINHEISSSTISGCVKVILDRITEIEKFWAYLPLELVRCVETIRENCGLKECLSPINSSLGIIQGILPKYENQILQNKYQILMNEIKILEKYDFIRIKRSITKDLRTDEERKQVRERALVRIKEHANEGN